ncbi:hypothetical protein H6F42_11405 [Pseudanabaena sp. FACHB-1998]|uniref:hormogonium polysaccharide biosynthesis protein HpsA n=1 Tax=Pseudanabaena sp. FACHB-1998 TaxID=2692858 RepID=UPI0016811E0A|nr:hormogonium polysaccharide biosynthesis protein HpsA [Pseudanabaena sp. FACHB-1998]MBD2177519.1 hypothetical protein [Pseudanabaena sp. FACHB-1998]
MSDSKQSRKINRFFAEFIAKLRKWLNAIGSPIRISRRFVRQLLGASRGQRKAIGKAAGFVLPTVTLVTLVVTLLVVTTVARSSERAKTAANARVEQVFRSAATPVVDRARSKIDALLNDGKLGRATPPEITLDSVITNDTGKYTFPDETRLQIVYDFRDPTSTTSKPDNKINTSDSKIENREYVSSAWKFPVDTDNNGLFDSYGIYSILFRARPPSILDRPIVPIESRTLPMDETTLSGACVSTGGVSNIAGDGGWTLSSDNRLKKAFFVYAVTVPITDTASYPTNASNNQLDKYELYKGVTSISAIELQQDRARSPQNNNAVFFEGDTELVNIATFRLNGRVYSAGNLMVGAGKNRSLNIGSPITFYQVSSSGGSIDSPPGKTSDSRLFGSCYYLKKNSEIVVAGNVVEGDAVADNTSLLSEDSDSFDLNNLSNASNLTAAVVKVHLFQGAGSPPDTVTGGTKLITDSAIRANSTVSVDSTVAKNKSSDLALNDFEYNRRIGVLVEAAIARSTVTIPSTITATFNTSNLAYSPSSNSDPLSVQQDLVKRIQEEALSQAEVNTARRAAFTAYFGERVRKVSFRDVAFGANPSLPTTLLTPIPVPGQPSDLSPIVEWTLPNYDNDNFGKSVGSFSLTTGAGFDGKGGLKDTITTNVGSTTTSVNGITLLTTGSSTNRTLNLSAVDPDIVATDNEILLGDRVLVGNSFPAKWLRFNASNNRLEFVSGTSRNRISTDPSALVFWNDKTTPANPSTVERYRFSQSTPLSNLGVTDRGGFWEIAAAAYSTSAADPFTAGANVSTLSPRSGGLRVVTNAGIYSRRSADTFLPNFRTGISDNISTTGFDESSAPLWNGEPIDNPITSIDETNFAAPSDNTSDDRGKASRNYIVWQDSMPMTSGNSLDTRKGDLQMRASAIYHYKYDAYNAITTPTDYQVPIACVSSYYDPSTPATAKNSTTFTKPDNTTYTLPWNTAAGGRSNNGIVYQVGLTAKNLTTSNFSGKYSTSTGLFTISDDTARNPRSSATYENRLLYQANLMFPNGRFANESLRNVLIKLSATPNANLTLPQQSTLDSNLCALQILDGTINVANSSSTSATITVATPAGVTVTGVTSAQIPHGAFRESAFLDGREVKSLNRNESLFEAGVGNNTRGTTAATNGLPVVTKNRGDIYDLELEQRQPLEIRATDIDMDRLRGSQIKGGNNPGIATDYLLPYSSIVYATREDALADLSYYNQIVEVPDPAPLAPPNQKIYVCTSSSSTNTGLAIGFPCSTSDQVLQNLSSTDFLLDATRKPSAIRLVNGIRLWRSALNTLTSTQANTIDGSVAFSDTNYANTAYKWTEETKGEKGLTLVSNLPVYVRAQYAPGVAFTSTPTNETNPTIPGFNKHTKQEFTLLLKEDTADINGIWSNFYKRHADNGPNDKLDGNFACRPAQTTGCVTGDQWRPTTVLADAVTVLSANFRDGYRTDGDYDIRNNSNTSTSINWQSQLNPTLPDLFDATKREPRKDSSYVLERRRFGFLNNNFVTSSPWLNRLNSDGQTGTTSNTWPAATNSTIPVNGNLASYNANGVTPIQRRISFSEYGMELCSKIPASECTFSDWVKAGAGTTTLPELTTGLTGTTPIGAPRYISPDNSRFARRLSFLRFDDIYKDGNQQLIFAASCANPTSNIAAVVYPIALGVEQGNDATTGFTYPHVFGNLNTPFDLSNTSDNRGNNTNSSFGTVPCPERGVTIEITGDNDTAEGRRRDFNGLASPGVASLGSLETLLSSSNILPTPETAWVATGAGAGNNNGATAVVIPATGFVTNSNDNNSGQAIAGERNRSTNNAVYRRFNFDLRLNNRALLGTNDVVRVKVTLSPRTDTGAFAGKVGDEFSRIDGTTSSFTFTSTSGGVLTSTSSTASFSDGESVILSTTGTLPTGLETSTTYYIKKLSGSTIELYTTPDLANANKVIPTSTGSGTQTVSAIPSDFLSGIYNGGANPITLTTKNGLQTAIARGSLYPRLGVGAVSAQTVDPEDSTCPTSPNNLYCTVVSWKGSSDTTGTNGDPDTKILSVLVVRDSFSESADEEFRLSLDNIKGPSNASYIAGTPGNNGTGGTNGSIRRGRIRTDNQTTACLVSFNFTNNDDNATSPCTTPTPTPTPTPTTTPTPTPSPSPTPIQGGGEGSLFSPVFAKLQTTSSVMPFSMMAPAAAYPFPHASGDIFFRPFNPPSNTESSGTNGGRYVWGDDINGNQSLDSPTERTDIFPNIPPRPAAGGEIPMLPGNFTRPISNSDDPAADTTKQMTRTRPTRVSRTLWYRTSASSNDFPGETVSVRHQSDRNLFINNLSFPFIGAGDTGTLRANLNSKGSLILPPTPCMDLTTGRVDDRCISKKYTFGNAFADGESNASVPTLLNLNLPYNPHYPSDNTALAGAGSGFGVQSTTEPATSFVVCGGTGRTRKYQAIERSVLGKTDISGGSCAQGDGTPGRAIRNFVGRIATTTTTATGSQKKDTVSLSGGSGLLSLNLLPGNAAFVGLQPDFTKKADGTGTRDLGTGTSPNTSTIDLSLRAINTFADNRVHVFNLNNIGILDGGTRELTGKITFRANCVNPDSTAAESTCTATSLRRGPSPVFILRGDFQESINFKGLQVSLDGVDPNNIFWVSSRTQSRLDIKTSSGKFLLVPGNGKDPRIAYGQRLIFSNKTNPVPAPLSANTTYYVLYNNGSNGNSSRFGVSLLKPPQPEVDCSPPTPASGCPAEITNITGGQDFALAAEPSFIFEGSQGNPNILTGNFFGNTSDATSTPSEDNTSVMQVRNKFSSFRGVRFLGLWGDAAKINNETLFVAMTSVDQPDLLPVLQINVPKATDASEDISQPAPPSVFGGINGNPAIDDSTARWTIRPVRTEVNVYFVAGTTPSRNGVPYKTSSTIWVDGSGSASDTPISTGETGGGLANFIRLLENWDDVPLKISGGFIQNTKSKFATAPYSPTAPINYGTSAVADSLTVFLNPAIPATSGQSNGRNVSGFNLQYMSVTVNRLPYYSPPIRLWGFDVGLLTQQPDLFAERFASPIAGANEYFREVNADDPWITTLLCALEPSDPTATNASTALINPTLRQSLGTEPTNYVRRALRGGDLRSDCKKTIYGGDGTTTSNTVPSSIYQ